MIRSSFNIHFICSNRPSSGASGRRNAVGKKKEGGYRNPLDRMEDDNGSAPKGELP